jgi:hypothetical protein
MLSRIIRRACEPSIPNNREESWVAQTSLPRCVGNRREAAGHLSPPRLRGSKMLALAYEHIVRRGGGSARKSINFRSISTRNGEVTRAVLAEPQAERAGESASCVIRRVGVTFFLSSQKPSPEIFTQLAHSRGPEEPSSQHPPFSGARDQGRGQWVRIHIGRDKLPPVTVKYIRCARCPALGNHP